MKSRILPLALMTCAALGCGSNDAEIAAELRKAKQIEKSQTTPEAKLTYSTTWRGRENVTIDDGVHVIGSIYPSLMVAIETEQGVLMFDTPYEEDGRSLKEALVEVNVPIEKVNHVFITHAHFDRLWGINALRKACDVTVHVGKADCAAVRERDFEKLHVLNADSEYRSGEMVVDRELEGGEQLDFGDTTVEVISTPGHTPGSVCYLVTKNDKRILITGDVIGSVKFGPEIFPVNLSPAFGGDAVAYLDTIKKLMAMDPPDLLLPGRPSLMAAKRSFAFEGDWSGLLEPARKQLEQIIERQKRDGRDSLDQQAKTLEDGLHFLGILDAVGVYAIQAENELVVINAPGGQDCSTFVGDRLNRLGIEQRYPDAIWLTSMDPGTTSGLVSFDPMPSVLAPERARRELVKMGVMRPTLIGDSLDEPLLGDAFDVQPIPVKDRQYDGIAYSLSMSGKQVLLTPPVPRQVSFFRTNLKTGGQVRESISVATRSLSASLWDKEDRDAYAATLERLAKESPDVWLPALPIGTQSANLYDDDWDAILSDNRRVVGEMRQRREAPF